jgi:large subunit ribosomal protein L27
MAHKKSGGSTSNVRDSNAQRLGVKVFGNQVVNTGDIIVRQRGTQFFAGKNVFLAKDHTLHAASAGRVSFRTLKRMGYDGRLHVRTRVDVEPAKKS